MEQSKSMNKYNKWVAMWGNAMSISDHRPATYAKDLTLRYPVYCPFNGDKIKITFDNFCGTEAVIISEATVLRKNRFYTLSFEGNKSVTIPGGKSVVCDELEMVVNSGDEIIISFYLAEFTLMRSSVVAMGPLSGGQFSVGNHIRDMEVDIKLARNTDIYYFLSDISVHTEEKNKAMICYGDSITAQDWPDYLLIELKKKGIDNISIIRKATSGSRILREYNNITYESYGLKGKNRFHHEMQVDGADSVIIQQGINDIIHPVGTEVNPFRPMSDLPTVEELIDGLKWYISEGKSYGYKVYLGTLLPIEGWRTYADFREEMKNSFNDWIKSENSADGCIDFHSVLCDIENPRAFKEEYDSGDHLHPSALGYQRMAEEVLNIIF